MEGLYSEIKKLKLEADILFVDDNSPDKTGEVIESLRKSDNHVFVIHRGKKLGVGSAHIDGIFYGYRNDYKVLITMDADFSHKPEYIPLFLENSDAFDVVVGSRFIASGSLKEWNPIRKMLTHLGHFLTSYVLRIPYDATGAYRLYNLGKIDSSLFKSLKSRGYSFFFESLYVLSRSGARIKEVPIILPARTYGQSKMRVRDIFVSVCLLVGVRFRRGRKNPLAKGKELNLFPDPYISDWEDYWENKFMGKRRLYNVVASFYRRRVIKNSLNFFIRKYNKKGSILLHAGCGSGEVDENIATEFEIVALDISEMALQIYHRQVSGNFRTVKGDIRCLPFDNGIFDCVYNLGVMEHLNEYQIIQVLTEFRRVLKNHGKIILFWPPEFGLSVLFFKVCNFLMKIITKKNLGLYPQELTRIRSKRQIRNFLALTQFKLKDCYFGFRDWFTYVVIVAEKTHEGSKK